MYLSDLERTYAVSSSDTYTSGHPGKVLKANNKILKQTGSQRKEARMGEHWLIQAVAFWTNCMRATEALIYCELANSGYRNRKVPVI